ncbi:MAG: DEAD/DEAH box helicase [Planctomycetota bacterium]|nr:MAG: DEAD/DEAH box helicase [Planctomycetota bacterium]
MKTFNELNLVAPVQRALANANYSVPTPIQAQTIPDALQGRDILGSAQTGTGKTAAFALPVLNRLGQRNEKVERNRPLALVLAPTRELAIQIERSFATYGKGLRLRQALVYGGVSQVRQVRMLDRGAHIVVATPGRLLDLMNQGFIDLSRLEILVLDEVDRMLDMGFLPDLKRIISHLPARRQSLFFSATLPPKIVELADGLLRNPVRVNIAPESPCVERIDQQIVFVERSGKMNLLREIVQKDPASRVMVFTRTKRGANAVAQQLERGGVRAVAIHGDKSQHARQKALAAFGRNHVQVLVATDVASRGIDIDGVSHVVNYDLPVDPECYVHRIGRTGRAGDEGTAVSFCSEAERRELYAIERFIGQSLTGGQTPPPSVRSSSQRPRRSYSRAAGPRGAGRRSGYSGGGSSNPSKRKRRPGKYARQRG